MIGKAKSNISLAKTIDYQLKQASELFYNNNLVGDNLEDYRIQMEDLQQCYRGYGKQLLIHTILSPSIEDGQKLDKATWTKMADMYLREMNLKENYLAMGFIHRDKEHYHCHIVISKINMNDYKLFSDSFIGKKTQHIADKIAQKFNLTRAMDIQRENLRKELSEKLNMGVNIKIGLRQREKQKPSKELTEPKGARQKFRLELQRINEQKFNNPEAYFQQLEKNDFKVIRHFDENRNLRGYSLEKDGTMLSATTVGKEFSLRRLGLVNDAVSKGQVIEPTQNIKAIQLLTNQKQINVLYNYLKDGGIDRETIDKSGVRFIQYNNHYYAALQNNSGGYTLANPFTFSYIGKEDVSVIANRTGTDAVICDDLFGYLHHIQNNGEEQGANYIVLNQTYDAEKLKTVLQQLKPGRIHFSKSLAEDNNNRNILSNAQSVFIRQISSFMDILFSDEHLYHSQSVNDFYEHRKKKKLKPNW